MRSLILATLLVTILLFPTAVNAQSAANVLVVINEKSMASQQVGTYYSRVRRIPTDNLLYIQVDEIDEIAPDVFEQQIERPIAAWFGRHAAHDRILYIVLTKGVPLRIAGSSGRSGATASVDSELTLLYRKLLGRPVPRPGPLGNPYFHGDRPLDEAKPFTHEAHDIFLVTRLDGFTLEDVFRLIDRGADPVRQGRILLDQKSTGTEGLGDQWLQQAADTLIRTGHGQRVVLESSTGVLRAEQDVLGYFSWGSNDPSINRRRLNLGFVRGALAGMFVSSDGRTFKEPPEEWTIGQSLSPSTLFAGSTQSLAGDLVREGASGVVAHVDEPYVDGTVRPQIMFPAYLAGFNLVEAIYLAIPYLSWQTIVIGDPLCAPFRTNTLGAHQIDKGLDSETELPGFFSARRLEVATIPGLRPDGIKLALRAEARLARDDRSGARQLLEQATTLEPRLKAAHLMLAMLYDEAGEHDLAINRYRQVLTSDPNEPIALNNLAHALAVHKKAPTEALPFARRSYELSHKDPRMADTLGWVYYLAGQRDMARKLLEEAVQGAPEIAEIRLHAAIVYASLGKSTEAQVELKKAIELGADLEKVSEARLLRETLK